MADITAAEDNQLSAGHVTGYGSQGYRTYVLIMLTGVYTLNFIDRNLVGVLAEPIITTFSLSDTQFGLLASWPFAIFYAVMGIPIAAAADRFNRTRIIVACIVLWSVMTALCGIAAGFITLALFRIGVAVGEAGCTPPANSIISDYYPPNKRATALGIYSMGVTLGGVLAFLFGGPLAEIDGASFGNWISSVGLGWLFSGLDWSTIEGWRIAFVVIGMPGVLVAIVLSLTVKEPPRGYSDPPDSQGLKKASMREAFSELSGKPTFWWMTLGASLVAFVGYGMFTFQIPFLVREHGLSVREASINFGAPLAALGALGTFLGGYLSDQLSKRIGVKAIAIVPAVGLVLAIPCYIAAFHTGSLVTAFIFWAFANMLHYAYLGAQYNIGGGVVSAKSRATAIAILLVVVSIIGNGIGPQFVGIMSDLFTNSQISSLSGGELTRALCGTADLDTVSKAICVEARSTGLKQSVSVTTLWFLVAAFCYYMSSRTLDRDYIAKVN
ncbi:MAG: MFS transporter [Pseudomonadota bacterium]